MRAAICCLLAGFALTGCMRTRAHAAAPAPGGRDAADRPDAGDNGQQDLTNPAAIDAVLVGKRWF
jgi:hypothetical protein